MKPLSARSRQRQHDNHQSSHSIPDWLADPSQKALRDCQAFADRRPEDCERVSEYFWQHGRMSFQPIDAVDKSSAKRLLLAAGCTGLIIEIVMDTGTWDDLLHRSFETIKNGNH